MAHENLRFNLILRRTSSLTHGTSSSLNPIYSDQAYGTHYGLFADFKTDPETSINEVTITNNDGEETTVPCFDVHKIAMILQNYTGNTSIGISKILGIHIKKAPQEFVVNGFSTGRLVQVFVSLQALSNKYKTHIDIKEEEEKLILLEGDMLEVIVAYNAVDNKYSQIDDSDTERNRGAIFVDEKYMWRDGEEIFVDQDLVEYRRTLGLLHAAGFFVSTTLPNLIEDDTPKVKDKDEKNKELRDKGHSIVSRPGDPRCKMKISDIYISE